MTENSIQETAVSCWQILVLLCVVYTLWNKMCEMRIKRRLRVNGHKRRVVITGAARGLGREIALLYAEYGARMVLNDREDQSDSLLEVAERCRMKGAESVHCLNRTLKGEEEADELREETHEHLGSVDRLYLNHAILPQLDSRALFDPSGSHLEIMHQMMSSNFYSHVHVMRAFEENLEHSRGKICVSNSISAIVPLYGTNIYASSKAALFAFFTSIERELKLRGSSITVTQTIFGGISTELIRRRIGDFINADHCDHPLVETILLSPRKAAEASVYSTESGHSVIYSPRVLLFCTRFLGTLAFNRLICAYAFIISPLYKKQQTEEALES